MVDKRSTPGGWYLVAAAISKENLWRNTSSRPWKLRATTDQCRNFKLQYGLRLLHVVGFEPLLTRDSHLAYDAQGIQEMQGRYKPGPTILVLRRVAKAILLIKLLNWKKLYTLCPLDVLCATEIWSRTHRGICWQILLVISAQEAKNLSAFFINAVCNASGIVNPSTKLRDGTSATGSNTRK